MPGRLVRLVTGLWLYGVSNALLVQSALGGSPWVVFHQGATNHMPLSFGAVQLLVSGLVLLAWIPLRQRPGIGTVANTLLVGPFTDLSLRTLHPPDSAVGRSVWLLAGVAACAIATAVYIGARLGPGPRDGLMTGLVACKGWSIKRARTFVEISVLALGIAMGGIAGAGTALFALTIGPLTQLSMRYLMVRLPSQAR